MVKIIGQQNTQRNYRSYQRKIKGVVFREEIYQR